METKFNVPQRELVSLLAAMQPICSKRTTLDVTESILFQITPRELTLKGTDLEISLRSTLPLEKNNIENSTFLVSGKRIFDLVRELDGIIEFEIQKTQLKLNAKGVNLALNIRDAKDFPPFPERIENLMDIDSSFLQALLGKVAFLIPQNHSNSALNGMYLLFDESGMSMVATDGHCLAQIQSKEYTLAEKKEWLIPRRAILEIRKILENSEIKKIFLGTCGNQLVFSGSNFNFFTKLLSEKFPQYKPILNKEGFSPAVLAKEEIVKTLKRANCFLAGQFISTKFKFAPGKLDLSLHNKEVGKLEETLSLNSFDGQDLESRFYSPYLLNGLSVFSEKELKFYVKNTDRPIIFESDQEAYNFTYLVMPVSAQK
ncbi:DNA polymerase III subunit beta [Candidatus Babeliales bacterium]|nr:DNA polymerase III subunit beta [Candidatus Babeliales bacterium]